MLPNWLYGKSKSKLASILGGGGGTPADYNQVKAQVTQNTDDIELLSNALDGKAALTQISNPNLLDNPWFTINQRGQSSYSGEGILKKYVFDRWRLEWAGTNVSITKNADGTITYTNNSSSDNVQFMQLIDSLERLSNRQVTLSIDVVAVTGNVQVAFTLNHAPWTGYVSQKVSQAGIHSKSGICGDFSSLADGDVKVLIALDSGESITIRAVKLELGSVSTLAMDTAPDYATELLKCQRYFVRIGSTNHIYLGTALALDVDKAIGAIKLPIDMRVAPSVTGITDLELSKGNPIAITALDSIDYSNGYLTLTVSASGTVIGAAYLLRIKGNAYLDFSAEL